jgi:pimeloyl-ACP methyl ester carboxylesterase
MARHGRDIGELLDHLGLDDVTLVGASMGGNAIWAYVDQFGSGRLRGVVIIDQTPKMLNTPDWPYGFYGYNVANAGILFAEGVPPTGAAGRQRSQGRGWPGWRSGWAGRRYSVTRPPRRRSGCCSTTRCRTGAMSSPGSTGRCSWLRRRKASCGRASTPRPPSPTTRSVATPASR